MTVFLIFMVEGFLDLLTFEIKAGNLCHSHSINIDYESTRLKTVSQVF